MGGKACCDFYWMPKLMSIISEGLYTVGPIKYARGLVMVMVSVLEDPRDIFIQIVLERLHWR